MHLIKVVEGIVALLEAAQGRMTEEQYLAGEYFKELTISCNPDDHDDLPPWAYGECDHSRVSLSC